MLVYKLIEQWKIPKWYTWKLIQKFSTPTDLLKVDCIKKYDLVESLKKEEDIKQAKFLIYTPFDWKYQWIIILWENQQAINNLHYKLLDCLRK